MIYYHHCKAFCFTPIRVSSFGILSVSKECCLNLFLSRFSIIAATCVWLKRIHVSILQRGHVQWRSKPIGYVQPYLNTSGKLAHQICKSPQHSLSFSGRSNFPSSASRWLLSFFPGRICKLQFFTESKHLSWPWILDDICSKEAETLCQGSRPSCIMRRLLRHSYISTAVGPCVCIIFNTDAYLKGIFEFPLHSRWLCVVFIPFYFLRIWQWYGSSRCGFYIA